MLGYRYAGLWVGLNDLMIYEIVISRQQIGNGSLLITGRKV